MRRMKTAAGILAALLILPAGMTAFAGDAADNPTPESNSTEIKATYKAETKIPNVYEVDVTWGSLEYTYSSGKTRTWNPETLKFEETAGTPQWNCKSDADKTITVANHSNVPVTAEISYAQKNSSGIKGTLSQNRIELEAPEEKSDPASPPSGSATLELSEKLADTTPAGTPVGEVTIIIRSGTPAVIANFDNTEMPIYATGEEGIYEATAAAPSSVCRLSFTMNGTTYHAGNYGTLGDDPFLLITELEGGHVYKFTFNLNTERFTWQEV